jgi:sporulation protein YlmC with PRC-barrel domain
MSRLESRLDGMLHLMDRQVVDEDGLLVCKVDDLELAERPDGTLVVRAILAGAPAWTPRISRWAGERWRRLGVVQEDRGRCYRIGLAAVADLSSEVRLHHRREHLLRRQTREESDGTRRLSDLTGAEVKDVEGLRLGRVLDVRLDGDPGVQAGHPERVLEVTGLVVGRGRPGGLLGYDRQEDQGPWLVNKVVRRLHRGSGMVGADRIVGIDWEHARVVVRGGLDPIEPAAEPARPLRDR